jgi:outer membrane lipoprotein-sorting protein
MSRLKLVASIALSMLPLRAWGQSAAEIVARADQIRNPDQPFRFVSTLTEYVSGKPQAQNVLAIVSKKDPDTHQFRNLVRYVEPPRDAGKAVLLDGRSLWFYDPASKSSVRISPQQRLIGQAAIGDVLTVTLSIDYVATLTSTESVQDASRTWRSCWHLDLKAANDLSTYARIEYWVEQGTFNPIKAKFYSDSGRLLKILYYRAFESWLGGVRPTEAVILDAVDSTRVTTVKGTGHRAQDVPETWFQREYLPRLQSE